jgi:Uma2 family endonuclease
MKLMEQEYTVGTLLARLGVPGKRVRLIPTPGKATAHDLIQANANGKPYELVFGTLVQLPVGYPEGFLGGLLFNFLATYCHPRKIGHVCTGRTLFEMIGGNIRIPDVALTVMERLPNPLPQIGGWCPDLCIEILSPSNTRKEMRLKRNEFFASGAKTVWRIDPKTRTAEIYTSPTTFESVTIRGFLSAPAVIPGYRISLKKLFDEFDSLQAPS